MSAHSYTRTKLTTRKKDAFYEVDIEYPVGLHELHNIYLLVPEQMKVGKEGLSSYSKDLKMKLGLSGKPTKKLISNLLDKKNYVLRYHNGNTILGKEWF